MMCKGSLPVAGEVNTFSGVTDVEDVFEDVVNSREELGSVHVWSVCMSGVCLCVCVSVVMDECDGDGGSLYPVDGGETSG